MMKVKMYEDQGTQVLEISCDCTDGDSGSSADARKICLPLKPQPTPQANSQNKAEQKNQPNAVADECLVEFPIKIWMRSGYLIIQVCSNNFLIYMPNGDFLEKTDSYSKACIIIEIKATQKNQRVKP